MSNRVEKELRVHGILSSIDWLAERQEREALRDLQRAISKKLASKREEAAA